MGQQTGQTSGQNSPLLAMQSGGFSPAQKHPLRFYDIYADIAMELPSQPNLNMVKAEINKVIRRINDEIGLWRELVKITPSTITTDIESMSTTNIESLSTTNIEDFGRFRFGWDWDSTDKMLRLHDTVVEVIEVYIDDEEWKSVEYQEVKDTNNSTKEIYAQIGRFIYFPIDLATETEILKIRVKRSYPYVSSVLSDQAEVDLPESYRQLLISGTLLALASRGKYKDEDIFAVNKEIFEREYVSLKLQYENLEVEYTSYEPKYKY